MISPFFDYEGRVVSLLGRNDSSHIDVLADQLLRLETESDEPITLYISSTGGNLIDALKIVDVMSTLQSHVTAIAMGLVQGAGVLIFATAAERLILPNALLATTGLWTMPGLELAPPSGFGSLGSHPRETLRTHLEAQVDQLSSPILARLVREAAGSPRLFTAEQAVALHLADAIAPRRKSIEEPKPIRHVR
jgi:hypothetical protein